MCKGVRHVLLTSGEYGFVVALSSRKQRDMAAIKDKIWRIAGKISISTAICHYLYTPKCKIEL